MDDLISRQAAIELIEKTIKVNASIHYEMRYWEDGMNCAKNIVEELPSAQRWIPVTERLPEENGYYLITGRQGAINKRRYEDGHWYGNWAVIAWMPLPEPWKGESDESTLP